jgi:uncharacterized protein YkwD
MAARASVPGSLLLAAALLGAGCELPEGDVDPPPTPGAAPTPTPMPDPDPRPSTDGGRVPDTATSPAPDPGPAPSPPAGCALTRPGGTGKEPGGVIPVCCTPAADDKLLIAEVFRLLNEHRAANGRSALMYDDKLEAAIQGHCRHMAEHSFFDHQAPEAAVGAFTARANLCGASASGENIAYNQRTPGDVMDTWIRSSGHNQNMLGANHRRVGICHHQRRWGQIFGR